MRTGALGREIALILLGHRNCSFVHDFWDRQYWTSSGPNHANRRRWDDPPSDGTAGSDTQDDYICVYVGGNAHDFSRWIAGYDA